MDTRGHGVTAAFMYCEGGRLRQQFQKGRSPDPALDEREDRFKNLRQASPRAAVRKLSIQISRGAERSSGRRTTAVAAEVKDDYCLEYEPV